MLITDWDVGLDALDSALSELRAFGDDVAIQHRHPDATGRQFAEEARWLRARWSGQLIVNGRLDVALLVNAHLHLPGDGPSVEDVRAHLPVDRLISVAVHSHAEVPRATGADFALVSPVFSPGSKPNDTRSPLGAEAFHRLSERLPCPALALGGMNAERTTQLRGAAGVATLSALWRESSPGRSAQALLDALPVR